jgi:hypothetical protein
VSHPYLGTPVPYGVPVPPSTPRFRPLRRTALVSVGLMGLTAVAAVIQTVVLWTSYDGVKRFVYGLVSNDEVNRGVERIAGFGPFLNLAGYLFVGTAIAFVIWLWQARENTEVFTPIHQQSPIYGGDHSSHHPGSGVHRHAQGWAVGAWVCPIVQFWYPLQIVQDVIEASEPPTVPGAARSGGLRALLFGWWGTWTTFWVILVSGTGVAGVSFIVWIVRLVDAADTANATGDYLDIYDLQDFMVRVALTVNIAFTAATVLLIAAGVMASLLLLRVTAWQDERGLKIGATLPGQSPSGPPRYGQPQYGQPYGVAAQPGPVHNGSGWPAIPSARSFPSYGGYQHQKPPGGSAPSQRP